MKQLRKLVLAAVLAASPLAQAADQVDINAADARTLAAALHGVGDAKAEAIVADRHAHGPFATVDDLSRVKGIGPATVDRNRERLQAGGSP
jgi:competence protein ComEA